MEKNKKPSFMDNIVIIYKILFYAVSPFVVALLPSIPYMVNESYSWSLWFMFVSMPVAVALMMKFWEPDFMNRNIFNTINKQKT